MLPMVLKAMIAPIALAASLTTTVVDTGETVMESLPPASTVISGAHARANGALPALAGAKGGMMDQMQPKDKFDSISLAD